MEFLRQCFPASIRSVIYDLRNVLDEAYERILLNIDSEKQEYAYRLFHCLALSIRPLRVDELAEILAIQFNSDLTPNYSAGWRPEDAEEAVLSAGSGLITVVPVDGSQVVQFSHPSIKEFLTSERLATIEGNLSRYHVRPGPGHTIMAKACLSVLLKLDDRADKKTIEKSPLALYAARHWVEHAKFGGVSSRIQDIIFRLFDPDRPHFRAWIWLYDMDRRWENYMSTIHPTRPQASSLYYAALCGFSDLVEHLVRTHPSVINARGGYHVTPLHASLGRGHKIMPRLLREDADIDVRDNAGTTPLRWVSKQGHLEMVHALVKCGADVDSRDNYNCTPLHWASHQGYPEVVRFLLGYGVDADARDDDNYTPLYWASQRGHLEVARALAEHGIDLNARDHSNWTSLHAASQNGHLEVVRVLLEHSADACASDLGGWTPLQWPSYNGDQEIVRVLLKYGADANTRDNNNWTPLHGSSQQGHREIVQVLLEHGADANFRDDSNQTPSELASRAGYLEIVKLLAESSENIAPFPGSLHLLPEDRLDTPTSGDA